MMLRSADNPLRIDLQDADILYFPDFLDQALADGYFEYLIKNVAWRQDSIRVFGKVYDQPRLTALYGNNGKAYSYSNITMQPLPFNDQLETLKSRVEQVTRAEFTTCLLNLYRDGSDSNGWHADDEKELGENPVIASISLGQERTFKLKHRHNKENKHNLLLEHGSLLLMQGPTQHYWYHQIPKSKKPLDARINLTFRYIK